MDTTDLLHFTHTKSGIESWLWIELIGFDNTSPDFAVDLLLHELAFKPDGVGLFLYTIDFLNRYSGLEREEVLLPECCSYGAHPFNVDRARQDWTNWQLRDLISELHRRQIKVYVSLMGFSRFFSDLSRLNKGEFLQEHPELLFVTRDHSRQHVVNVMKRFRDGRPYEDFFINQLVKILLDYGFDGIQVADGLSSPIHHMENGDYSDDMIEQFTQATGVALPAEFNQKLDDVPEAYEKRGAWIWRCLRTEWLRYHVARWDNFYRSLTRAVHSIGRQVIFNNALTMDPVEAIYRYGVDYRSAADANADGYIVEEVSAGVSLLSGNVKMYHPETETLERMKKRFHCSSVILNMKAYNPGLKHLFMTTLRDTAEQFDILHDAPRLWERYIYTNLNLYYEGKDGLDHCCDGPWFCLSDGLKRADWTFIRNTWNLGLVENVESVLGATTIWSDQKLYPELDFFINTRLWTSNKIMSEFMYAGAQLNKISRIEDLPAIQGGIFVPNFHLLPEEERNQVMAFTAGCIFLFGQRVDGMKPADFEYVERMDGTETVFAVYNSGKQKEGARFQKNPDLPGDKLSLIETNRNGWPNFLAFENYSQAFIQACAGTITELTKSPRIDPCFEHCSIISLVLAPNKLRLLVGNDSFWYATPTVDVGRKIEKIRMLTRYAGYPVAHTDTKFSAYIPPRGMDIVELEWT